MSATRTSMGWTTGGAKRTRVIPESNSDDDFFETPDKVNLLINFTVITLKISLME